MAPSSADPAHHTGASATNGADVFQALLARLAQEPEGQGYAYETLRARLIQFFRLHDPAQAEALADATLDRIARKVHAGTVVENLRLYALAVARHVLQEAQARTRRERRIEHDPSLQPDVDAAADAERLEHALAALRACADTLGTQAAALIFAYYGDDGTQRIRSRQRLAAELRTSVNALRNRALRVRETLERCVRRRLAGTDAAP